MTGKDRFYDEYDDVDRRVPIDIVDVPLSEFDEPIKSGDDSTQKPSARDAGATEGEPDVIQQLTKERDEYLDALRRLQAEFENFRKRTIRQQTEHLDRASLSLLERLLPVLDALDLALAHAPSQGDEVAETDVVSALVQIAGLARATLEKEGLERIDQTGVRFDPTIHDAVSRVETDAASLQEPTVLDVMRSGYRLKGKVIRPAMVSVKG